MSRPTPPHPYNFNSIHSSDQQFVLSAQWNWNTLPQGCRDALTSGKNKNWRRVCFATKIFHVHHDFSDDFYPVITGHLNHWHQTSQTAVIVQNAPRGLLSLRPFLTDAFLFPVWRQQRVHLMCPGPVRRTSRKKNPLHPFSHLCCDHRGWSRGRTSHVPHFGANLSFHSPSLLIKQHKWLNLHDGICNMANQVSDTIKHYTGTLS